MNELLLQGLSELGLDVSRAETLERFSSLLLEKNQVMNLTAITEPDAVAQLHLLDSAALLPFVDLTGKSVVDVGTGAGFPGMPLRILKDDFDLTLLDSLGKRVNWLQEVCDELQLKRVACVHARAEEFAMQHREQFDIATSRAVAQLSILSELCLPLIKVGGQFIAMKSVDTEDEIAEGLSFIKSLVDNHVMMNLKTYYSANSDTATHQSNEWITGKIAGIFEWDSAATKYSSALDDDNKDGFTVGEEIKFGDYNGGFSKVSMDLAITKTCEHPAEAATLINFLLNEEKGASIMGSECGIPASKAGLAAAQSAGAVKELVAEANGKVMAFVSNQLDPLFESNDLKATGTGIYQEVFDTLDYDNASGADLVDTLLDGMESVGYTV